MSRKKLVVLSGAGISAESGLKTFRDSDGLWEGYDVTEVATPRGWRKNPQLVLLTCPGCLEQKFLHLVFSELFNFFYTLTALTGKNASCKSGKN